MAARKRAAGKSTKPVPPRRAPTPRGVDRDKPALTSPSPRRGKGISRGRKELPASFELDALVHAKNLIREVKDFPKRGILFYDITTLLADARGLQIVIDALAERLVGQQIDHVVAIESRGFIFGGALAARLNAGFVPVRKPGKLPYRTDRIAYALEYGEAELEMHRDSLIRGGRVVIVDDLLATGGTAKATAELVGRQGGVIVGYAFVIELTFLDGRSTLAPAPVLSLIQY